MEEHRQQTLESGHVQGASEHSTDDESVRTWHTRGVSHDESGTNPFANAVSAPWSRTGNMASQEYGAGRLASSLRPTEAPRVARINNPFHNDSLTMNPQRLLLNTHATPAVSGNQTENEDVLVPDVMASLSPLRRGLENMEFPMPSPVDSSASSSAESSYPEAMISQRGFYGLLDAQYQIPLEGYWQHQVPETYPLPYYGSNSSGLTPNEDISTDAIHQGAMFGYAVPPGVLNYGGLQVRENNEYNLAEPPSSIRWSTDTSRSSQELTGVTVASGSLTAGHSYNPPIGTPSQIPLHTRNPPPLRQILPRTSAPGSSRPFSGIVMSTGHGPDTRIYDPSFGSMRPHVIRNEEASSRPTPTPAFAGLDEEGRINLDDKGKGKSKSREDNDQPARLSLDDEISSPDRTKRDVLFTRVARKGVNRIRRAAASRPSHITCPFCKDVVSNHKGFILQHVEACNSPQVQAIRAYQGGPNRSGASNRAKIRCPDCRGRRRSFETSNRWADHLCHVHGEWITYECDIPGCGEKFISEWDRNEHKRREH